MAVLVGIAMSFCGAAAEGGAALKPSPEEALARLKAGNQRFAEGNMLHERLDAARMRQAAAESQARHAYATVLSCSDSRVPVEAIFDAGIMDLFVVRVAGNVCNPDEIGSVEYGLAHVLTPVLVVMGHTQCGAVTAVVQARNGHGHPLERNIPALVAGIGSAVERAAADHPGVQGDALIPYATEANIWQSIENLFLESPAAREMAREGKVKVLGAMYDLGTGRVEWLSELKVAELLNRAEADPRRAMNRMAE
jgi:carbonic anhydrase